MKLEIENVICNMASISASMWWVPLYTCMSRIAKQLNVVIVIATVNDTIALFITAIRIEIIMIIIHWVINTIKQL